MATATEPEVITLGAAAIKRLSAQGSESPTAVSPLANVLRGAGGADAAVPSDEELAAFQEEVAIVTRPEAYVRILVLAPDSEDEQVIGLLAREGKGVSFSLGDDLLHLGRAQPLEAVVASLAPTLTHEGPLAGNDVWLWPSVVQMLTALWQENPDPSRSLVRADVIARLTTPEFSRAEAEKFVQGVVGSGAVKANDDVLSIQSGLRPWLALLWSGHAAQVEYVPLPAEVPLEEAIDGPRQHLLFMGPTPQRIRNDVIAGDELQAHLGGRKGREASMLHLSAPPVDEVANALRALLKVEPA
jgi:hypothetical protein